MYGYELWVVTGRVRLWIQAAEISSSIGLLGSALETETPLLGALLGVPGMTNWEETPRQTQNSLEGLYIAFGLGTPQDPPRGAGKRCWGEVRSGIPFLACCLHDQTLYKQKIMDGWMEFVRYCQNNK